MFGIDITILAFIGLVALSIGGLGYALMYNRIVADEKKSKRFNAVRNTTRTAVAVGNKTRQRADAATRRKSVEDTLKAVESQKSKNKNVDKPPLDVKLEQAGINLPVNKFYMISAGLGFLAALGIIALGITPFAAIGAFVVFGYVIPNWVVNMRRNKRIAQFLEEFPNAVDIIVRGVRSGLPLNDCLRIISKEAKEPVRSEFVKIVEAQKLGLSVPEAVERLAKNVPLSETSFFSIVIAIQAQAGGNLSEALGNLSKVLRDRKSMKGKIKAMSMEAKASAVIIGALPIIVGGLVYVTSPGYLTPLFTEQTGQLTLLVSAGWMGIGIFIMKQMINFDF
jgi:tight adherence protein B